MATAYIDSTGPHRPDYPTALAALQTAYRAIYGEDVYLEPDSQDGQFLAIVTQLAQDVLDYGVAVYNNMSPSTAVGVGLSRVVKINGIRRQDATLSTADLVLVGQAGAVITDGQAEDVLGQRWLLPPYAAFPLSGTVTVTAKAVNPGAVTAAPNTITKIATPTLGWQTVNNPTTAATGAPVESDAALRLRQRTSTALPSLSVLDGLVGAVANVAGVTRYASYENDTNVTDVNGIAAHSISLVVDGGTAQAVADAIALHKTPGTGTFGTTSITTFDSRGVPNVIRFYRPTAVPVRVAVSVRALQGYTTGFADLIKAAVVAAISSLAIGDDVLLTKLYVPVNLPGTAQGATFNITALQLARPPGALGAADVVIAFNEVASCVLADVTVTVVA